MGHKRDTFYPKNRIFFGVFEKIVIQRKNAQALEYQGFRRFVMAGAEGRKCPLAVPESRCSRSRSVTFDRCANPCSLFPPPAAVASVARHAVLEAQYMVVIVCYNHNR